MKMIISQLEKGIGLRWRDEEGEDETQILGFNEYRPYMYVNKNTIDSWKKSGQPSIKCRDRSGNFIIKIKCLDSNYKNLEGEQLTKIWWSPNNPKYARDIATYFNKDGVVTYESDVSHHYKYAVEKALQQQLVKPTTGPMRKWYWDMEWQQGGKHDGKITCIVMYDSYDDEYTTFVWYPKEFDEESMLVDTPIVDDINSTLVYADSESKMIRNFLIHSVEKEPDMLISWFGWKFDLPKLIERAVHYNIDIRLLSPFNEITGVYWKKNSVAMNSKRVNSYSPAYQPIKGIVTIPLDLAFERQWNDAQKGTLPSLALDYVAQTVLGEKKLVSEKFPDKNEFFARGWLEDRYNYLTYALQDVRLIKLIDDTNHTTEAIVSLQRLLAAPFDACFYASNMASIYFMRNADWKPRTASRDTSEGYYRGAMVYDPATEGTNGLYENVAAFDFASLYPSVMIARNISWETRSETPTEFAVNLETPRDFSECEKTDMRYFKTDELGVLPRAVLNLMDLRNKYKRKMKKSSSKEEYNKWNNNQLAVKRLMASFYGIIGYKGYGWADIDLAACITASAREAIREAAFEVRRL